MTAVQRPPWEDGDRPACGQPWPDLTMCLCSKPPGHRGRHSWEPRRGPAWLEQTRRRFYFWWYCPYGRSLADLMPMCLKVSPGTEYAWLPSRCEHRRWHKGCHLGQYGETWTSAADTDLAECIPYRNDDPALPHPDGYHPAPGSRPSWWPGGHPDEAAWEREILGGFTYADTYDAGNPETAWGRCDECGQHALCTAGYSCPATCRGACGTDGCTAVIVLCEACGGQR